MHLDVVKIELFYTILIKWLYGEVCIVWKTSQRSHRIYHL